MVAARLVAHREAVDDHQLPVARRLEAAGLVTLVEDLAQLEDGSRGSRRSRWTSRSERTSGSCPTFGSTSRAATGENLIYSR